MDLYRVLLADDEEDIRVGISQKMQWESLGFTLVGEAANGRDALELAEALKPDVVLTDIRMPFMDGLTLCRLLSDILPASKFVVFSGYDDFEYAKQAVSLNVSEYILKPINASELADILQRLKTQLDSERTQRLNEETLRQQYEENLPLLRELYYTHLMEGRIQPGQEMERAEKLGIGLFGDAWVAALAYMSSATKKRELAAISLRELAEENLNIPGLCAKVFLYNDNVAILAGIHDGFSVYDLTAVLDKACALAENYLGLTVTVGVGAPVSSLSDLHLSADGARTALDYRGVVGTRRAIYIGDVEPDAAAEVTFEENDERTLVSAVKLGNEEDVRAAVGALMEKLTSSGLALSQCNLFLLEFVTCLLRIARGAGLRTEDVFGSGFTGAVQVTDYPDFAALGQWCLECCLRLHGRIRRRRTDSAGHTVEKAKEFIAAHFGESDLSVEMLCEHLHLSPAYFSTLFKRETGMGFSGYVTEVRMAAAAEALRTTQEKTYLIAHACGYDDPNYFSYVFKRHFGVTPTKYRAE